METFRRYWLYEGNPPVTRGFLLQRPVTQSFDAFFDLRLNKRLSKQSRRWWFQTLLCVILAAACSSIDRFVCVCHYSDGIMSPTASQITGLAIDYSIVYSGNRSKKTSKLCSTGLCAGNSPETGEFPAQMASNAENVSIWWRHHGARVCACVCNAFLSCSYLHETCTRHWSYEMFVAHTISGQRIKGQGHRGHSKFLSYPLRAYLTVLLYTWHKYSPWRDNVLRYISRSKRQKVKVTLVIWNKGHTGYWKFCRVRSVAPYRFGWITPYMTYIRHMRGRCVAHHF